jgi:hypothetical protein
VPPRDYGHAKRAILNAVLVGREGQKLFPAVTVKFPFIVTFIRSFFRVIAERIDHVLSKYFEFGFQRCPSQFVPQKLKLERGGVIKGKMRVVRYILLK